MQEQSLGPVAPASPLRSFRVDGNRVYVITRYVTPTRLGVFDLDEGQIVDHCEVPDSKGAWAMVVVDGDLYVGSQSPARLLRYDPATGDLSEVAEFDDEWVVITMDVHDGIVYAGTYPNAKLFGYDVAKDELRAYGEVSADDKYVRGVGAADEGIYVGVGMNGDLRLLDQESGEHESILPAELAEETGARDATVGADWVGVKMRPSGRLLLLSRSDPGQYRLVRPQDRKVGSFRFDGGVVRLVATQEDEDDDEDWWGGSLYEYDLSTDEFTDRGTLPSDTKDLQRTGDRLVGCNTGGDIWTYDIATGDSTLANVEDRGMPLGAETPFSLAVVDGVPVAAGHRKLHVHDGGPGDTPSRATAPYEGKASVPIGDTLYLGFYQNALVGSYSPGDDKVTVLGKLGEQQNRPRDVHYHAASDTLYVGTAPDYGNLGGALGAYDVGSGAIETHRNAVPDQSISAVTSAGDRVFIGSEIFGEKVEPVADEAVVAEWDPERAETRWEMVIPDAQHVAHLVAFDGRLYGTAHSDLFAVDPDGPELVRRTTLPSGKFSPTGKQLLSVDDVLYCLTGPELLAVDPDTLDTETLVDGLEPSRAMLAADEAERLYTLRGTDLVRLTL